ncbi:hypothetical protein HDU98_011014 [Podochytrium sp. JEL0797]|nr:hypothetical protein HDU98_011014 [Podochytrium sp. JEL0797]
MSNDTVLVTQAAPSMTNMQYLAIGTGEGIVFQMILAGSTGILWHNWRQLKLIHYIMLTFNDYDDPVTGLTWNLSDIFMDLASTVISVHFCWGQLTSDFNQIAKVIVTDNILRSAVTFAVNICIILFGYYVTDPFWGNFIYAIRDWIYVFSLNAELFWKEERERSFNASFPKSENRETGGKGVIPKDSERTKSVK